MRSQGKRNSEKILRSPHEAWPRVAVERLPAGELAGVYDDASAGACDKLPAREDGSVQQEDKSSAPRSRKKRIFSEAGASQRMRGGRPNRCIRSLDKDHQAQPDGCCPPELRLPPQVEGGDTPGNQQAGSCYQQDVVRWGGWLQRSWRSDEILLQLTRRGGRKCISSTVCVSSENAASPEWRCISGEKALLVGYHLICAFSGQSHAGSERLATQQQHSGCWKDPNLVRTSRHEKTPRQADCRFGKRAGRVVCAQSRGRVSLRKRPCRSFSFVGQ